MLFQLELSVSGSITVNAESSSDALAKFLSAHKAGIDPMGLWFSENMFSEEDFPDVDLVVEETPTPLNARIILRNGRGVISTAYMHVPHLPGANDGCGADNATFPDPA
ncbi:hypothetical protein Rleg4DRAFT_2288 [Rhizobium leguminosarum bv. trifolii WSM2297]|uniref:Uncharacterized protein n=1 Tax=Rhizobium leguminosarum bv. trifolii WSM2297 TaxID=754762 RepID=J0W636_RHILT|nr:hypothetical protein [Rhizobium leguminosarum]EJC80653.1 hypothetical protein Rleg4DRAFT_2288 [Rhizobium leguminosarum bv. trifolii WSM2297]